MVTTAVAIDATVVGADGAAAAMALAAFFAATDHHQPRTEAHGGRGGGGCMLLPSGRTNRRPTAPLTGLLSPPSVGHTLHSHNMLTAGLPRIRSAASLKPPMLRQAVIFGDPWPPSLSMQLLVKRLLT